MRNQLRQLVLCLIIALLPMQGIAAGMRFECALAHQSAMLGNGQHLSMLAQSVPAFGPAEDVKHHTLESMPDANATASDCENIDIHEPSRCGTCATCCISAYAPLRGTDLTTAQEGATSVPQPSVLSFIGHIPARIERPPRPA